MNSLLENGLMTPMDCGSNFSYILSDNNLFLVTEYKMLQSQVSNCFVKCMKMQYNGKVQLYYLTTALKPFSVLLPTMDPESFLTIVSNILNNVVEVKHNGFLSCQNLDISFERIYIDPTTYKVRLVYLPLARKNFADYSSFENELRTSLVKLISGISTLAAPKTMQLSADLSNGTLSLEDLCGRIKGGKNMTGGMGGHTGGLGGHTGNLGGHTGGLGGHTGGMGGRSGGMGGNTGAVGGVTIRLTAMNAPQRVELIVNKDSYVIGKNAAMVDGVVSFNKLISRVHCQIDRRGNDITVTDLESANGTFVNRVKLIPRNPAVIQNGDVIRMANSDFQVTIK